jgi:putative transposase
MPRIPRGQIDGQAFHVLNRGNGRATVFLADGDYRAFIKLLAAAKQRAPMGIAAFCLMPNHFHCLLMPAPETRLGRFMQWWMTTHVRRHHAVHHTTGHVWQGRFKSFPVERDDHFLTVVRYIVHNPVRARLVERADHWPWSSLSYPDLIDPWPVAAPADPEWLAAPLPDAELERLRSSVQRHTPYGTPRWQRAIASLHGLESTLRRPGRPPKRGQAAFGI